MARTRSTRRLPPRSHYTTTKARSAAQVAAGVPPTRRQFECAFDYQDELTVLDYLKLSPTIQHDMQVTEAYITEARRLPPALAALTDDANTEDPFLWFWPNRSSRLLQRITVFEYSARHAFYDVIAWLFGEDRERIARIGTTLTRMFPSTLCAAAASCDAPMVEVLLVSPVFLELLSVEAQQSVLDKALRATDSATVCELLVAHGATFHSEINDCHSWALMECQGAMVGSLKAFLQRAVEHRAIDALERGLGEARVADHSVLMTAVEYAYAEDVEMLLTRGFVDVDARSHHGTTALIVCAEIHKARIYDQSGVRSLKVLRCLLGAGADTSVRDSNGATALHLVVGKASCAFVELLLDYIVATRGVSAVHSDVKALELACETHFATASENTQRVVTALLTRGACTTAYEEMARTGRPSISDGFVCHDPKRCMSQGKRKRVVEEEDEGNTK